MADYKAFGYKYRLARKRLPRGDFMRRGALIRKAITSQKNRLPSFVLAQADPFDRNCFNAKVPDSNTAPSSAFHTLDSNVPATSTTNAVCTYYLPVVNAYANVSNNNIGATSWTWQAAYAGSSQVARVSGLQAQYALVRPVAHGIRLSCNYAESLATGYVHVALYALNMLAGTTWQLPTSIAQLQDLPYYQRFTLSELVDKKVTVVNKYLDPTAFVYRDPNWTMTDATSNEVQTPGGWMGILVVLEGVPSGSAPVTVENIIHWEGQSLFSTLNNDSTAEPPNQQVMDATAIAVSRTEAVSDGPPKTSNFLSNVASALDDVIGGPAEAVASAFHPIAGGTVRFIRNVAFPSKRLHSRLRENYQLTGRSNRNDVIRKIRSRDMRRQAQIRNNAYNINEVD